MTRQDYSKQDKLLLVVYVSSVSSAMIEHAPQAISTQIKSFFLAHMARTASNQRAESCKHINDSSKSS